MSIIQELRSAVSRTVERLVRFREIWSIFGLRDADTWRTLFPPYRGWDVGCYYCACYEDAIKAKRCEHGKLFGWSKCGTTEKPNAGRHGRKPAQGGSNAEQP